MLSQEKIEEFSEWIRIEANLDPVTTTCPRRVFGKFFQMFSFETIESVLNTSDIDLQSDEELLPCPLNFYERQELRAMLGTHLLQCKICADQNQYQIESGNRIEELRSEMSEISKEFMRRWSKNN